MESFRAENEAITKYQFNKEQIALFHSLSHTHSLFPALFVLSLEEWKEWCVIISPLQATLLMSCFYVSGMEVVHWDVLNGP